MDFRDIAKKFTDLKLASDTRPPNFSGAANDSVDDFVRRFQRIGKALEWTDQQLLQQAPIYLTDFAATWYDKETQDGVSNPWTTWDDLKKALIARFRPRDILQRYKAELRRCRQQKGEDVSTYFNKKAALCYQVYPKMSDTDVIEQLKDGLLSSFYKQVVLSQAKTPVDFYADLILAQTAERREKRSVGSGFLTGSARAPFDGRGGGFRTKRYSQRDKPPQQPQPVISRDGGNDMGTSGSGILGFLATTTGRRIENSTGATWMLQLRTVMPQDGGVPQEQGQASTSGSAGDRVGSSLRPSPGTGGR